MNEVVHARSRRVAAVAWREETRATARGSLGRRPRPDNASALRSARDDVEGLIEEHGWRVDADAPVSTNLAQVLAALRLLGCDCEMDFFTAYAEATEQLIVRELDLLSPDHPDRAAAAARSVLLEVALTAMRRMALEHHVALRFG